MPVRLLVLQLPTDGAKSRLARTCFMPLQMGGGTSWYSCVHSLLLLVRLSYLGCELGVSLFWFGLSCLFWFRGRNRGGAPRHRSRRLIVWKGTRRGVFDFS